MGPSRSSSLRIGYDSSTVAGSGRVRDAPCRLAAQHAVTVGPSKVDPSYRVTFA